MNRAKTGYLRQEHVGLNATHESAEVDWLNRTHCSYEKTRVGGVALTSKINNGIG